MDAKTETEEVVPVRCRFGRGWDWVAEGFRLFVRAPWQWLAITLIWGLITIFLAMVPVVSLLVMPLNIVFIGGLMLGCDALARNQPFRIGHLFSGFKIGTAALIGLGGMYLAAVLVVMLLVGGVVWSLAGSISMGAFVNQAQPMTAAQLQLLMSALLIANLLALVLLMPVLMAVWFAPALIVLRGLDAITAAKLSLKGCQINWLPFLLYSLVALALMLLALVPFGLGLLIVVPVLIGSVYASYRDIYPGELVDPSRTP